MYKKSEEGILKTITKTCKVFHDTFYNVGR